MKIIHVLLGKANPERMNGVNKVAHSLATNQAEIGVDVEIWGITPTPEEMVRNRLYHMRLFQSHINKWNIDPPLKKAIDSLDKDSLVHFHAGFIPEYFAIAKLLYQKGIPYVITAHGNYMIGAMKKNSLLKKAYFHMIEKDMLKRAHFIHCIGQGEITDLNMLGISGNIKLIPNGQDFSAFNFPFQELARTGTPVFGFCGRITRFQKGLDLLLEGFRQYKTELKGSGVLWLIGEGDYKEDIENFVVKNGLKEDVKLFGSRFGEEKLNIMANMDAFYHPSRNEGLPMAVLEAASLSKMLVVSEFTNMTRYVSDYDAGICLKQNTTQNIAYSMNEVEKLYKQGTLPSKGRNARKMAEENFDWTQIAVKMLNAYAKDPALTGA